MADRTHGQPAAPTTSTVEADAWDEMAPAAQRHDAVLFLGIDLSERTWSGGGFFGCTFRGARFNSATFRDTAFVNCTFVDCALFDVRFSSCPARSACARVSGPLPRGRKTRAIRSSRSGSGSGLGTGRLEENRQSQTLLNLPGGSQLLLNQETTTVAKTPQSTRTVPGVARNRC
jgi:hypothetical protein